MKLIVTGAAGFVGANVVKALNARGMADIIAVDNLSRAEKMPNLADCEIADYFDKQDFIDRIRHSAFETGIAAVLHQGACSDTMETDGRYMMENNYRYSVDLLEWCQDHSIPFIYASSASVYGGGTVFKESREHEAPLNVYGYSKFLFDQYVRRMIESRASQVAGFRYFNVYGPRESHKGRMASVAFHFFNQYLSQGKVKLFEGSGGYGPGEQIRDFISVEDVVRVNLFFLDHPKLSGIFNVGTGKARSFNDVAAATINAVRQSKGEKALSLAELKREGAIEYIAFPAQLVGKYQSYTQADMSALRAAGYTEPFLDVEQGVARYVTERIARGEAGK
ncbi:ADP-glyceromanno-heptose 6-epimerase [Usitatibacter palustris]|uniref:ADP-L-glycero-D-manno-heptose-6-epimerase n=1 Tax=Usitatibacter palustris TaxID=2732487 RepID=A0A6M4H9Z2_9PROT|nr:ADP-glyceromanno-heptose 6-epimerase [Usitatibacter palustris]QJR15533.1 ADP-L-glycero-D-manno-heptose-6-epimerase [Usitatibacter palustris]